MATSQSTFHELRGSTDDFLERRLGEIISELFAAVTGRTRINRNEGKELHAEHTAILAEQRRREAEQSRVSGGWSPDEKRVA